MIYALDLYVYKVKFNFFKAFKISLTPENAGVPFVISDNNWLFLWWIYFKIAQVYMQSFMVLSKNQRILIPE